MVAFCCQPPVDSPSEDCHHQCANCRLPNARPDDYEIQMHVDFENRLLRPLGICGIGNDEPPQVLLFAREKCSPDCVTTGCLNCRTQKLYQETAGNLKGAIAFRVHSEYLYCLRFGKQPATALLSLTPREQSVEVKELGLLAYWFVNWHQRAKADDVQAARAEADDAEHRARQTPSAVVVAAVAEVVANGNSLILPRPEEPTDSASDRITDAVAPNSGSKYLPNLRIIYQVKKQLMTVTLPEPKQLTREIDVLLASRNNPTEQPQTISLRPGEGTAAGELQTMRNTPYTLMLKLKDRGRPVKLMDLVTERKVLRVQESLLAPKHMKFLMERLVGERATFVLHITFDDRRPAEVDSPLLGEFYLDVDVNSRTLSIGTVKGHEQKQFRLEQLLGPETKDPHSCNRRKVLFEGGVNQKTLFTDEPICLQRSADYLITALDTASGTELPTSLLSFRKTSLLVKEVKGSDVKLHVMVQRQYSPNSRNENNFPGPAEVSTVRRCPPDGAFQCPMRPGCAHKYRIQHNAARGCDRSTSRSSSATTAAAAVAAAEALCHSSGSSGSACASFDDSGLGRNPSSLPESLDSAYYSQQRMRRRLHWGQEDGHQEQQQLHQQQQQQQPTQQEQEQEQQQPMQQMSNVNLDVDMPTMQARLLAGEDSGLDPYGGCYMVVEDSLTDGRARSVPCLLGQPFSVRRWCRYTIKAIGANRVSPLFTFRVTDTEVTNIQPCTSTVRLTTNVSQS